MYELSKISDNIVIWIPVHKTLKGGGCVDYVEGNVLGEKIIVVCHVDNHVFIADSKKFLVEL